MSFTPYNRRSLNLKGVHGSFTHVSRCFTLPFFLVNNIGFCVMCVHISNILDLQASFPGLMCSLPRVLCELPWCVKKQLLSPARSSMWIETHKWMNISWEFLILYVVHHSPQWPGQCFVLQNTPIWKYHIMNFKSRCIGPMPDGHSVASPRQCDITQAETWPQLSNWIHHTSQWSTKVNRNHDPSPLAGRFSQVLG